MKSHEIIRNLRQEREWSQKEMAEKLNISVNGYSKIERGETGLNLEKLERIAHIFEVNMYDLLPNEDGSTYVIIKGDNNQGGNFYHSNQDLTAEITRLKLIIQHKDELLAQQARELANIQKMLDLWQSR